MSRNLLTCYLGPNFAKRVWVYSYKIQEKTTRRDWEGRDVCRFSLAAASLKLNNSCIWTFSGVYWAVLRTWWTFYCSIACQNNSFGKVAWENKYDFGKPETCKNPRNITNEVILRTLWVCDYNNYRVMGFLRRRKKNWTMSSGKKSCIVEVIIVSWRRNSVIEI